MRIEICIENENEEFFKHEGYYDSIDDAIQALQFLRQKYSSHYYCPYRLPDCIYDPGYLPQECPEWYIELYGNMTPEEVAQKQCLSYCKDGSHYDDEDK